MQILVAELVSGSLRVLVFQRPESQADLLKVTQQACRIGTAAVGWWKAEMEGNGEGNSVLVQKPGTWGQGCATDLQRDGTMLSSLWALVSPQVKWG